MILEHFAILAQIQGLDKQIGVHLKTISTQEERLHSLKKTRNFREVQLKADQDLALVLKSESAQKEKELFEIEKLIARSEERKKTATNEAQCKAIENELAKALPIRDQLEEESYQLMERQEVLSQGIKDHQDFLEGSLKSLNEIEKEVVLLTQKEKDQIQKLEERIHLDLESLPVSAKNLWNDLNKKFRFNSPLTFVESGACQECRYSVGRNLESQIEKGGVIEFCPNCKRLLAPRKRV